MSERYFSINLPEWLVKEPVLYTLVRRFGLTVNIFQAKVTADSGWLVACVDGDPVKIAQAVEDLRCRGAVVTEGGRELVNLTEPPKLSSIRVRVFVPKGEVDKPVLSSIISDRGVMLNIRQARIDTEQGVIDMEVFGTLAELDATVEDLKKRGVRVDPIEGNVIE
ncbi:MAG: hypothetical protein HY751_09410 [Nitrospinae bacterium]|nr:hypothetical protein [Nitrospinota bacterium]